MIPKCKKWLRATVYWSGLSGAVHRWRNRNTLTVLMFHRVLPAHSASLEKSEREFAFSTKGFARCLDFVLKHYSPVSLDQIKLAMAGERELPPCAALVTFDDGWHDTLLHALPELASRNIPGVLFLATEVVELASDRWWQDALVEAMRSPDVAQRMADALGLSTESVSRSELGQMLTSRFAEVPDSMRLELLSPYVDQFSLPRQMLGREDLAKLAPRIVVAGHGHTHGPLTHLADPEGDLRACRERLKSNKVDARTLSFPHGRYNQKVVDAACLVGFEYLFSSDPHLVSSRGLHGKGKPILGRIHIPENTWTCDGGEISFPKLSTFLFFRKVQ